MKHLLELIEDLERRDVALVSLNEQIDTNSANGRLILRLLAALTAFERDLLSERTSDSEPGDARATGRPRQRDVVDRSGDVPGSQRSASWSTPSSAPPPDR